MTREEWLRAAVEQIDSHVYGGDLDLLNKEYQIACGRCAGQRKTETIVPKKDTPLEDSFPTTINVDYKIKDPLDIVTYLAHECMKAFLGARSGKKLAKAAETYFWDDPYKEPHPSPYLLEILKETLTDIEKQVGPWPGHAIVIPVKEPAPRKPTRVDFSCPECGWKVFSPIKMMEGRGDGVPTCICGTKMILERDEEEAKADAPDKD